MVTEHVHWFRTEDLRLAVGTAMPERNAKTIAELVPR
jgi:hypothetical protein